MRYYYFGYVIVHVYIFMATRTAEVPVFFREIGPTVYNPIHGIAVVSSHDIGHIISQTGRATGRTRIGYTRVPSSIKGSGRGVEERMTGFGEIYPHRKCIPAHRASDGRGISSCPLGISLPKKYALVAK